MKYTQLGQTALRVSPLCYDVANIGARHPQQLKETAAASVVSLSEQMLEEIEQIMTDAAPIGGPTPEGM
ncbi:MAG TPA: hypothetical protein VGI81_20000 [Tepidisphaeraceae bacterium]